MENPFKSIAIVTATAGKRQELFEELLKLTVPSNLETGCLEYVLFEDKNKSGRFIVREAFKDKEAFGTHIGSAHFQEFIAKKDELIAGEIESIELTQLSE